MLERLVAVFCAVDDFYTAFFPQWAAHLIGQGSAPRGPAPGRCARAIITLLLVLHGSRFKYLKNFDNGPLGEVLRRYFPRRPCDQRLVTIPKSVFIPLRFFLFSRLGRKTGVDDIDSTALPGCHNRRIRRHQPFASLAARGKPSMGWCVGFTLPLVFNDRHEIVALKLTGGSVSETKPVRSLTKDLLGKLLGDKGYLGKELAQQLCRRGLARCTRVRNNMKSRPLSMADKILLNARHMAETIIGSIKAFSSLNLPKHRSPINAFLHTVAAVTAYQINPLRPNSAFYSPYPIPITI